MELIVDKANYDDFLKINFISGNFLQSSIWRNFLKAQNKNFWQLAVLEDNEVLASCLLYENKLPFRRSYLYSPKGPVFSLALSDEQKKEALALILSKIRDVTIDTRNYQEIFYKLELDDFNILLPEFVKTNDVQPRDTLLLDLTKDHKKLLAEMHAKTRYNISLARRKGLKVEFSQRPEDIKIFLDLIKKTAVKNKITVHSDAYYSLLWQTLLKYKAGELCMVKLEDKVIAANIIIRFGQAVTYLHGAADYKYRSYMAPHLLQWETILRSQSLGYSFYDFWGIAPEDGSKSSWQGFTRFKMGFGGQARRSPGAYAFVYYPGWYKFYLLANKIRNIIK